MARHGWTKADVRRYLATHARRTVADLKRGGGLPGTVQPVVMHSSIFPLWRRLTIFSLWQQGAMNAASAVIPLGP